VASFEESLNDLLVDTFNTILKYEEQSLKAIADIPITIGEAHLLECIARLNNEATVSQIAAQMQLAMPTITIAVKKLESKGYVVKVPWEDDGRRSYVRLTASGEVINRAHTIFHHRMVRNIADQFNEPEKEILLRAVTKLSDFFAHQIRNPK